MASTQLSTVTSVTAFNHNRALVLAGTRLFAAYSDGTDVVYRYSDDSGGTWSGATTIRSGDGRVSAFYDSVNGRLCFVTAGGNSTSSGLYYRAITSNVTSGTPGSLSTEATIDAGGSNLGVVWPYALHTATGTRPRYWVIAQKTTAASTYETRAWYVNAGSDADTGGNWVSTNFTNLGSNSGSQASKMGVGAHWTVSAADKLTFVFGTDNYPQDYESVTFDPTAVTPTPGTVTSTLFAHASGGLAADLFNYGGYLAVAAKADYLVFGRLDASDNTWDFFKTVNGTTWTSPSGWSSLTMGTCGITKSSSDFYLVHSESYGAAASTAQNLKYRKITSSTDTMGGVTAFSDTAGNPVAVPLDTGTTSIFGLYRASTASPYSLRSDFVAIGGGGDTTPPSAASVEAVVLTTTSISLTVTMPADVDVAQYEVRHLTGSTAPATDRSDGTISTAATNTAASALVTPSITGLTSGTRITGRVFVKDTAGNWNTGTSFTIVPNAAPAFLRRLKSDGVTEIADGTTPGGNNVILEFQLNTGCFETGGANGHFRFRVGYDDATPPTQNAYDLVSTGSSQTIFRYEHPDGSGTFVNVPSGGLASTYWARKLRVYTSTTQSSQYGSLRVEQ